MSTSVFGSSIKLTIIGVISIVLLTAMYFATKELAAAQKLKHELRLLNQVLPQDQYDNELQRDVITVSGIEALGGLESQKIYRAYLGDQPVAAIMQVSTTRGYNGEIRLVVAIRMDGTISGVRITEHKETPSLGDGIDIKVSDWVLGFDNTSLRKPTLVNWAVHKDGGDFDQFTGATITPRAVVIAVYNSLEYFSQHKDDIFAQPRSSQLD